MTNEPRSQGSDVRGTPNSSPHSPSSNDALSLPSRNSLSTSSSAGPSGKSSFFAPRSPLNRGFSTYHNLQSSEHAGAGQTMPSPYQQPHPSRPSHSRFGSPLSPLPTDSGIPRAGALARAIDTDPSQAEQHHTAVTKETDAATGPDTGLAEEAASSPPRLWQRQPYSMVAHTAALAGSLTAAWLLGILVAQILPGQATQPPLQETLLRKSSRLASRLWNMPQLWDNPTQEIRVEAIPLPETGPILEPMGLSPVERQPLIDELNIIETEILTLDRRLQRLEKQLGKPPYQDADIENRVNTLRAAIDPPVRPEAVPRYKPKPTDPRETLLSVAKLRLVLPSDALFTPGQSDLKSIDLLTQVLDQLVNYPGATVLIQSYSDDQTGAIASRDYTLAQANTLSRYLRNNLPGTYRWVTVGGGSSRPTTSNHDAAGRQRNRRIEILVDTR